jgi:hypothetical protein
MKPFRFAQAFRTVVDVNYSQIQQVNPSDSWLERLFEKAHDEPIIEHIFLSQSVNVSHKLPDCTEPVVIVAFA